MTELSPTAIGHREELIVLVLPERRRGVLALKAPGAPAMCHESAGVEKHAKECRDS